MVFFLPNKELFTVKHAHQCMTKPARRTRAEVFNYKEFCGVYYKLKNARRFRTISDNSILVMFSKFSNYIRLKARAILRTFKTLLVPIITNCTRSRAISYTNFTPLPPITIANRLYMADIICADKREITCRSLEGKVFEWREPAANAKLRRK